MLVTRIILMAAAIFFYGVSIESALYFLLCSTLLTLSITDAQTRQIPLKSNGFIFFLGLVRIATDISNWQEYIAGFFCVSSILLLAYVITKGNGIGGGDIKLMAVTGLVIGWERNLKAFFIGSILGLGIQCYRIRRENADNSMALGPYLGIGIASTLFLLF